MADTTGTTTDIRATRVHAILTDRQTQVARNLLAEAGGGPYIDERLSRFPSESALSWDGNATLDIASRKNRAFLINYAGRVVSKISQYVFAQGITREGIDATFEADATKTGLSIGAFMREVTRSFVAGGWAWIGVDRGAPGIDPATGKPGIRSVADRKAAGDRIFWSIWNATEVVDWKFDGSGDLEWLITQEDLYMSDGPADAAETRTVRTVWEKGGGVRLVMKPDEVTNIDYEEPFTLSAPVCPFVLVGVPSTRPHWFDDVERIQAAILNLESAHHENLIKAVFPQLVIPASLIKEIMSMSDKSFDEAVEMVRGIEWPLMEPTADSGITRLIMPSSSDLEAIPKELLRRRRELFDVIGQALHGNDSKQVESAEAKAWDNRDIEATLADNADVLEDAEWKAVEMSRALDTSFPDYAPQYPRQFDLPNMESDWKILTEMENTGNLPDTVVRHIAKVKVKILDRIVHMDPDDLNAALQEIDEMNIDDLKAMTMNAPPNFPTVDGEGGEGDDDEGGKAQADGSTD